MQYDDKNTFVLFTNEKTADNQPDYKGSFTDESGKQWDIAAWKRTSKKGTPFLSGKVSEPFVKPEGKTWEKTREKFAVKKDVVLEDITDEVDLSEIPF